MISKNKARQLRAMIEKAAVSLDDGDALDAQELYPYWEADTAYKVDDRLRYEDKLFKVLQAHTSQAHYPPSIDTASLYAEVARPGEGDTPSNPIAYNGNMELFEGKYYAQDGVVYRCTRNTGVPVYAALKDLVNLYVEVV